MADVDQSKKRKTDEEVEMNGKKRKVEGVVGQEEEDKSFNPVQPEKKKKNSETTRIANVKGKYRSFISSNTKTRPTRQFKVLRESIWTNTRSQETNLRVYGWAYGKHWNT